MRYAGNNWYDETGKANDIWAKKKKLGITDITKHYFFLNTIFRNLFIKAHDGTIPDAWGAVVCLNKWQVTSELQRSCEKPEDLYYL